MDGEEKKAILSEIKHLVEVHGLSMPCCVCDDEARYIGRYDEFSVGLCVYHYLEWALIQISR